MAQPNQEQQTVQQAGILGNVRHRTVTLDGVHNKNKALYRLGVTADEIHRDKALKTMGGTEGTYQETLEYLTHNHQPTVSSSMVQQNLANIEKRLPPKPDPLELEYTQHSNTAETIILRRESESYSNTWTHSHNPPQKNNQSNSWKDKSSRSTSTDHEEKDKDKEKDKKSKNTLSKNIKDTLKMMKSLSLESDSKSDKHSDKQIIDEYFNRSFELQPDIQEEEEKDLIDENTPWLTEDDDINDINDNDDHSSEDELTAPQNEVYVKKNPHIPHIHERKTSYAQDDIYNDKNPINSKKLFEKRKSDSFFMNNHNILMPRPPRHYTRTYQRKKPLDIVAMAKKADIASINNHKNINNNNNNNNNDNRSTPKSWYPFGDGDNNDDKIANHQHNGSNVKKTDNINQSQSLQKKQTGNKYESRRKQRIEKNRKHPQKSNNNNNNNNNTDKKQTDFLFPKPIDTTNIDTNHNKKNLCKNSGDFKPNPYGHPNKSSPATTPRKKDKKKVNTVDLDEDQKKRRGHKKAAKLKKPKNKTPTKDADTDNNNNNDNKEGTFTSQISLISTKSTMTKQEQRALWKQKRQERGHHDEKSDVINSSKKVRKFFGDDPQQNKKLNWKVGASIDEMMKIRSLGIVNITEKDDQTRKRDKKQFTRKAKFMNKISQIKLKWSSSKGVSPSSLKNVNDIESTNFLGSSSFEDCDDENNNNKNRKPSNGTDGGGTDSTNTTDTDNDISTMIIYPYNNNNNNNMNNMNNNNNNIDTIHQRFISEPKQMSITITKTDKNNKNKNKNKNISNISNISNNSISNNSISNNESNINGIRNGKNGAYHIDQSLFGFQTPNINNFGSTVTTKTNLLYLGGTSVGKRFRYNTKNKSRSPSPNGGNGVRAKYGSNRNRNGSSSRYKYMRNNYKSNNKMKRYGFKPNGKINFIELKQQIDGLRKLLSEKKTLSEIIDIYYKQYGFCVEFIVYLLTTIDETCPEFINVISRHIDKQIKILHGLSLWQYLLRNQLPNIDIKRFFYSFGPLIGKYKTLISPLHLSARKLIECSGGKESHITESTSPPECLYAFNIFKWLLFIGYDIDDGDIDGTITPQTILHHSPRILKQILAYQRMFLHQQRECMKCVDNIVYKQYKLLLDDDILQVIEKFTYNKYRKYKGFGHKKFGLKTT